MPPKKVLMLVSDLGFHWRELTDAFHVFSDANAQLDFASPRGRPKADALTISKIPKSRAPETEFFGQPVVKKIKAAKRLAEIDYRDYDAIYVVGGSGASSDLAANPFVKQLLSAAYHDQRWVGGRLDLVKELAVLPPEMLEREGYIARVIVDERAVYSRSSRKARKVAIALIKCMTGEGTKPKPRVAEFLDRKAG